MKPLSTFDLVPLVNEMSFQDLFVRTFPPKGTFYRHMGAKKRLKGKARNILVNLANNCKRQKKLDFPDTAKHTKME